MAQFFEKLKRRRKGRIHRNFCRTTQIPGIAWERVNEESTSLRAFRPTQRETLLIRGYQARSKMSLPR